MGNAVGNMVGNTAGGALAAPAGQNYGTPNNYFRPDQGNNWMSFGNQQGY
jgi:hypothetical protein